MASSTVRWSAVLMVAAVCLGGFCFAQDPPEAGENAKKIAPAGKVKYVPPPVEDANDLSMEVAALRTMHLMNLWPDSELPGGVWAGVMKRAKEIDCAEKPRKRKSAAVSEGYLKVLTELRTALITGQADRIVELSDRLEELADDEELDLDDEVAITPVARKMAVRATGYLNPERVISYLNAYGKEFPSPQALVHQVTRGDGKGEKPSKETRDFVVKEVSWQLGGLNLDNQKAIGQKVVALLDHAEGMTNEQTKNAWKLNGPLRLEYGKIKKGVGALDILKHVLEQDMAELLSNPRLLAAIETRIAYLRATGLKMEQEVFEKE